MRALALDAAQVPRHFQVRLTLPGGGEPVEEQVVALVDADVPGFTQRLTGHAQERYGAGVSVEVFPA